MKSELEPDRDKCKQGSSGCTVYEELDFRRYTLKAMTILERERFDDHCESCVDCLRAFYRFTEKRSLEELTIRTLDLLDRLDKE